MSLQDTILKLKGTPLPDQFQGVTKSRIRAALKAIDRASEDMVDAIFALLDNETPSLFGNANPGTKLCDGASTQHIAYHIGILQRDGTRLDREGRDYWIKPLRELGAVEPVYLQPETGKFISGHPIPKSPNSAYKLAAGFRDILASSETTWEKLLKEWIGKDNVRTRLELQAKLAELAKKSVDTKHSDLINACQNFYASSFLPGYKVIYIDDGDGDRITEAQKESLKKAGVSITLKDAMPDILLWNAADDSLWVIEAVTSDGEVDLHKVSQLTDLAKRSGKKGINFTTAYQTWKNAAARQSKHKNVAPRTYIWILEDPTKHFLVIELGGSPDLSEP